MNQIQPKPFSRKNSRGKFETSQIRGPPYPVRRRTESLAAAKIRLPPYNRVTRYLPILSSSDEMTIKNLYGFPAKTNNLRSFRKLTFRPFVFFFFNVYPSLPSFHWHPFRVRVKSISPVVSGKNGSVKLVRKNGRSLRHHPAHHRPSPRRTSKRTK